MIVKAIGRNLKVSPRKMGEVAALVRGRTVIEAQTILEHTPRKAARFLKQVIDSAQSNAVSNHSLSGELRIHQLLIGPGPVMKRYRAHSRLNVRPIRHRLSNVRVELEPVEIKSPAAKQPAKTAELRKKGAR